MTYFFLTISLLLCGAFGSYITILCRDGRLPSYGILLVSIAPAFIWLYIVKRIPISLSIASVIFDVVLGLGYFIAFIAMGEQLTRRQLAGCIIAIVGLALTMKAE
jgi:drug/metabolite transporter (DMT)-like permease